MTTFGMLMTTDELLKYDYDHLWHPYTSTVSPLPVYPVAKAEGCEIILSDGKRLIDGMSSWWCVIHGYNHPELNKAIEKQLKNMAHVMFGGLTHEPAVMLAQKLIELTPKGLEKVFFCDSGSVAVEVAMKMALQYWEAKNKRGKNKFATIHSGYHGDTWNAMSVSDPKTGMHQLFYGGLPVHFFADQPKARYGDTNVRIDLNSMEKILKEHANEIAAVILEPIVQGAGGMWFYSADYLRGVSALCRQYKVLLICDEIATGFGRTGKLFACEHAGISPDILCLGKAITGGYMSFAATLATDEVANTISSGSAGVFMHGPTFMANPLACSVANRSIELLLAKDWKREVNNIQKKLEEFLAPCSQYKNVADVRVLGAVGVVEMKEEVDVAKLQKQFVEAGVWIRPFGKWIYLMPPYIISDEQLKQLCSAILNVIK